MRLEVVDDPVALFRALMQVHGLNNKQLARRAGVHPTTVGRFLDESHIPRLGTLFQLASVFFPDERIACWLAGALIARECRAAKRRLDEDLRTPREALAVAASALHTGKPLRALPALYRADQLARASGDVKAIGTVLLYTAHTYDALGATEPASACYRDAKAAFRQLGLELAHLKASVSHVVLIAEEGCPHDASVLAGHLLARCEEVAGRADAASLADPLDPSRPWVVESRQGWLQLARGIAAQRDQDVVGAAEAFDAALRYFALAREREPPLKAATQILWAEVHACRHRALHMCGPEELPDFLHTLERLAHRASAGLPGGASDHESEVLARLALFEATGTEASGFQAEFCAKQHHLGKLLFRVRRALRTRGRRVGAA